MPRDQFSLCHQIKEYIDANYKEHLTLTSIADAFYLNKFYLSKMFKKEMGETVNHYVTKRRIRKARELLSSKALSVEQVSDMVGFSDVTYFVKVFKKITGDTPKRRAEGEINNATSNTNPKH